MSSPARRSTSVRAELVLDAGAPTPAGLIAAVALRPGVDLRAERLAVAGPDGPLPVRELRQPDGTRLHEFELPAGTTRVCYEATARVSPHPAPLGPVERWEFTRPSRFCPSDRLVSFAAAEFGAVPRADLPARVAGWVHEHTAYVCGSSAPTDGALETLLARRGVCRDFAHLVVALLRALDVPARLCAAYAPGLSPMDFHAVVEAAPAGCWEVVDATRLAPRDSLLRITCGRDATDTAFLTTAGPVALRRMSVLAVVDGPLPVDQHDRPVVLA
ncbi:transglutaminase-like domain-containing protein [Kineococcus sp. SYSU DK003]|uniref:transglutaminase-like domain-containing protein n=1 Tax=Kineococcus sp. SYSU DK003 TaxID=3383124 RepID=UPI003D7D9508